MKYETDFFENGYYSFRVIAAKIEARVFLGCSSKHPGLGVKMAYDREDKSIYLELSLLIFSASAIVKKEEVDEEYLEVLKVGPTCEKCNHHIAFGGYCPWDWEEP